MSCSLLAHRTLGTTSPPHLLAAAARSLLQTVPCCSLCGEEAGASLAQLWGEERDAWVQVAEAGGRRAWCHRRCHVGRQLEAASYRKARSSHARAKQLVYPSPSKSLEATAARRSRRVAAAASVHPAVPRLTCRAWPAARGWCAQRSICLSPCAERYGLSFHALEPLSEDAAPQPAGQSSGVAAAAADSGGGPVLEPVPPAGAGWPQLASAFDNNGEPLARRSGGGTSPRSDLSVASSLPCSSDGSQGSSDCRALRRMTSSSGSSEGGWDPSGRRLHRPSPIKLPALLEARLVRKRSSRLGFDRCAQLADPDGAEGRAWYEGQLRQQHERDLAEAAAAAARQAPTRRPSLRDAFKAASQDTFSAKCNMRA